MGRRQRKQLVLIIFDVIAIILSGLLAYAFLTIYVDLSNQDFWYAVLMITGLYLILAYRFQLYSKINRYTSIRETLLHMIAMTISYGLSTFFIIPFTNSISLRFMVLSYFFSMAVIPGSRVIWRVLVEHYHKRIENESQDYPMKKMRTIIVGAGSGGSLFVKNFDGDKLGIELVGIVDDDPAKQGMYTYGIPVLGKVSDLETLVSRHLIEQITIAIPSLKKVELERIIELAQQTKVKVNKMPSIEKVITGQYAISEFQEIDVVDLLGRDEVQLDMDVIGEQITGKTILVTGAGGSIGSEIARQITRFSPKKILLLGHERTPFI